ncbi:TetR/AcrR family transcriptional regulator [Actinomadura graeca]|uniref:TetR/AcrR family transcriptional regulator n=1 Tax=Actinomadura graeca TaxID=2750812 RepID=A0ABX8QXJ9_9ACTN|nr:TetR/AcrR family transcriptional regulator [Actinomadura graeca]QXJ23462.1 TetR/AcrR family transcriptional regulator [Actinomadura graeca]
MAGTSRGSRERPGDVWTRPRGGRRPKLTREAIVETAIKIADTDGLDAVSIRRIAGELGVRAMSLYTHIDAKEELFDLMYDVVAEEVLIEGEIPDDWREAILEIACRERDTGLRHPWMFQIAGRSLRVGPNGLRHAEQSLAAAARLTDDPKSMLAIITAVDHYMLGFTLREQRIRELGENGMQQAQRSLLEQAYVRSLMDSGKFPYLKPVFEAGIYGQDSFDRGLKWLLDGIEHEYREK